MSTHTDVSCDSCMASNFATRRYKCLLCENYDLCGRCYDAEAESQNHKNNHPMQCILTEAASELFYAGEPTPQRSVVSFTCPYCGLAGFIPRTLLTHCAEKHSSTSPQVKNTQVVMCPICVSSPAHRSRSRFVLLADHIATAHYDGTAGGDEELISSSFATLTRRAGAEEEDSDDEDGDEEENEEPSLNDLEHRAFVEEEHRRQETARQRPAHASSLTAAARSEYAAALSAYTNNSNVQRRPLSRQTAIRISRGGLRSHFNTFPYGSVPRTTTTTTTAGFTSNSALRCPPDASTAHLSQVTSSNDPFAAAFGQDPMLEFVSQLVNSHQSSTTSATNTANSQFIFGLAHRPAPTNNATAESARLQQQIENNETMAQIKTSLLNAKQKRSSQAQQQPSSSAAQPVLLTYPSGHDYQLWQQKFPTLQSAMNNLNFLPATVTNGSVTGNSNTTDPTLKVSHRDNDSQSLLSKIFSHDRNVNKDETNEILRCRQQDHVTFLQSLLLSSIIAPANEEKTENSVTVNKENYL